MEYKIKVDVPQEQVDTYAALAVEFIRETKGWQPEEYMLRYQVTLADAPLAVFTASRHEAREEMRKQGGLGTHPTGELQVYIQTEEMRAFADYGEFERIRHEAKDKNRQSQSEP